MKRVNYDYSKFMYDFNIFSTVLQHFRENSQWAEIRVHITKFSKKYRYWRHYVVQQQLFVPAYMFPYFSLNLRFIIAQRKPIMALSMYQLSNWLRKDLVTVCILQGNDHVRTYCERNNLLQNHIKTLDAIMKEQL